MRRETEPRVLCRMMICRRFSSRNSFGLYRCQGDLNLSTIPPYQPHCIIVSLARKGLCAKHFSPIQVRTKNTFESWRYDLDEQRLCSTPFLLSRDKTFADQ